MIRTMDTAAHSKDSRVFGCLDQPPARSRSRGSKFHLRIMIGRKIVLLVVLLRIVARIKLLSTHDLVMMISLAQLASQRTFTVSPVRLPSTRFVKLGNHCSSKLLNVPSDLSLGIRSIRRVI